MTKQFDFYELFQQLNGRYLYQKDTSTAGVVIEGIAARGTLTSSTSWILKRTITSGGIETVEYANDGAFAGEWDNRVAEFGPVPFANNWSTQFNGVNNYCEAADDPTLDFGRLDAWSYHFQTKDSDPTAYTLLEKVSSNTGTRIYKLSSEKVQIDFRGTGTSADRIRLVTASATTLNDGFWHQWILTYDGSGTAAGVNLYGDGAILPWAAPITDGLVTDPINAGNFAIGGRTGGGDYFQGNVDEVAVWNTELTAAEVTALYNGGLGAVDLQTDGAGYISSASLVSWWRMGDDDVFPTIVDVEGNNDLTMINMTAGDFETVVP